MTTLLDEIKSGPLAEAIAPHIAAGNDGVIAEILNAPTIQVLGLLDRADFATWAAATGMRAVIQQQADTEASPLRSIALTLIDVLQGASSGIDFARVENQMALAAWDQSGLLSAENKASMLALATKLISRAEQALGHTVTAQDVAQALRP